MFRRILVGFDGSRDAREALRAGISMAATAEGGIAVVIVVSASHGETEEDRRRAFDAEAAPLRAAVERELQAASATRAAPSVHVETGDRPAEFLAGYAEERGFDLVIVGRHGRERASHGGLGRVAAELAEKAHCPVLLVGDGEAGQAEGRRAQTADRRGA